MKDKQQKRLLAWLHGELDDDDLTRDDIRELEERTMMAIAKKTLERPDVHVFPDHKTLQ
jgi:hypothetical protein